MSAAHAGKIVDNGKSSLVVRVLEFGNHYFVTFSVPSGNGTGFEKFEPSICPKFGVSPDTGAYGGK